MGCPAHMTRLVLLVLLLGDACAFSARPAAARVGPLRSAGLQRPVVAVTAQGEDVASEPPSLVVGSWRGLGPDNVAEVRG